MKGLPLLLSLSLQALSRPGRLPARHAAHAGAVPARPASQRGLGMLRTPCCARYDLAVQSMGWQQLQGPGRGTSSGSRPLFPRMEKLRLSMRSTWAAGTAQHSGGARHEKRGSRQGAARAACQCGVQRGGRGAHAAGRAPAGRRCQRSAPHAPRPRPPAGLARARQAATCTHGRPSPRGDQAGAGRGPASRSSTGQCQPSGITAARRASHTACPSGGPPRAAGCAPASRWPAA